MSGEVNDTADGASEASEDHAGLGQDTTARPIPLQNRFLPFAAMHNVRHAGLVGLARAVAFDLVLMTPADGKCEITNAQLGKRCGLSASTAGRALRELRDAGLIIMRRRGSVANVVTWTEASQRTIAGRRSGERA